MKIPCQIQSERYRKYGAYRGNLSVEVDGEKVILSNVFTTESYIKELGLLFDKQREIDSQISQDFIDGYFTIFKRKRAYYEGPGNELSRTNYGKYTLNLDADR